MRLSRDRILQRLPVNPGPCCKEIGRWPMWRAVALAANMCMVLPAVGALLEFEDYLQRAEAARQRGDWQSVASQLAQALNHPDLPAKGPQRSAVHLAYGQAVGVFCQYAEAEKFMRLAKDIALAAGRPTFDAMLELAILHASQQDFARALEELGSLVQDADAPSAQVLLPQRLALAHERLAIALVALGRARDAAPHRDRALTLRSKTGGGRQPGEVQSAPYGSQCAKP